jgi:hypothetical protein
MLLIYLLSLSPDMYLWRTFLGPTTTTATHLSSHDCALFVLMKSYKSLASSFLFYLSNAFLSFSLTHLRAHARTQQHKALV